MTDQKRILIADDDLTIIHYLSTFIPLLGPYQVEHAFNGIEALAKINAFEPELLIVDLVMPKMNGREVLKEVREKHSHIKVLILTAMKADEQRLLKLGAQDVLFKPFQLSDLSQKVKNLLPAEDAVPGRLEYARLLIADDEPFISESLKSDLEPLGIEVFTACDGKEALKIFKEKKCNLAILDVRMPKMDGTDLVEALKTGPEQVKPEAIFILTAGLGSSLTEFKRLGCSVFNKPMDTETLKKSILSACEKFHLALKN